ncbi:MAG: hypothetical protein RLZZ182_1504 [Pseudomonadota bacterium]|jgi:site-specific DNA-adenine methylase
MTDKLQAPFPWFGGKSRVNDLVWSRFGDVPNYIEPFFGSGAMLLGRPEPFDGNETINDKDGLVANFWRAVRYAPDEVAAFADWPVNENDLHARHIWLVERKDGIGPRLEADPDWFDAKVAGWWCWGLCCWIDSGWCSGEGPWQVQEVDGVRQLVHLSGAGQGVVKTDESGIYDWMRALSDRLRRVRVCCGDWRRITGGGSGAALRALFASGNTCAVFLDPPYSDEADRNETLYREDCLDVAHDVREWAISHGDDLRLRIALCGYEGEHEMPENWECVAWKAHGGYGSQSNGQARENSKRERIWFSPGCLKPQPGLFGDVYA